MIPHLAITSVINHLLAPEAWARDKLRAHAGKIARIDVELFAIRLKVSADGMVEAAAEEETPNVTISIKPGDLPLIAQNRERAFSYVKVDGDADFANTISQLSESLRWEAEEDLSKLFGDVAA
ncbi:SCP2 domain-containing protein, partial [Undibacterium sp.]|uniref:ubiquinone biosynthesis accessory factor UbiJ n=1 Tax=Undibacterium sp. TaxID=1914977 RepID=UPI00374DEE0E